MMKDKGKGRREDGNARTAQRRDFLKLAGLGTLAGAAAAVAGAPQEAQAATAKTPSASGYRETEHVKKAYALSRF
jgi:anaerobic selenocysteine-containing dehydrogenase